MAAIQRLLIANRGEIACRIIDAARSLGITTIAVFEAGEQTARHVTVADEAVQIQAADDAIAYLDVQALLAAARQANADAVHPGYGFLSESPTLATACQEANLIFVGPQPHALKVMGDKARAKAVAIEAGVPCVPGYHGADQAREQLEEAAARIGYPLLIKATAGGGGRGMRLVEQPAQFGAALDAARAEVSASFSHEKATDAEVVLEKLVRPARHIEIQILCDDHGNAIYLGERECSVQRRHQKVIEEAPSAVVDVDMRAALGEAALAVARAVDYRGAGTVEFLVGADGDFYFLEMNTRLQVEHPVTEAVTGVDLVAWQLRIAAGQRLSFGQSEVTINGHAIEARLYAEAPEDGFIPQTGDIALFDIAKGDGIRVERGLERQASVGPRYDPLLAKVIAYGCDRQQARQRLAAALSKSGVLGVKTNQHMLVQVLRDGAFADAAVDTGWLERQQQLSKRPAVTSFEQRCAALLYGLRHHRANEIINSYRLTSELALTIDGQDFDATITPQPDGAFDVTSRAHGDAAHAGAEPLRLLGDRCENAARTGRIQMQAGSRVFALHVAWQGQTLYFSRDAVQHICQPRSAGRASTSGDVQLAPKAPSAARVIAVFVKEGQRISVGEPLAALEAMKIETRINSQIDGIVEQVCISDGEHVTAGSVLCRLAQSTPKEGDC
jgi:geranyl-CoA carboxylase alpha subunit